MEKRLVFIAVAVMATLFAFAACGGDSDTTTAPTTSAPAAAPQQPEAPAAAPQPEGITAQAGAPQQPDTPVQPVDTSGAMPAIEPKVERVVISFPAPSTEGNDSNFDFSSPPSVQLRPMYDYLVGVNPETGAFEPQLATEWSVEPDGLGIRFKLREGVQFPQRLGPGHHQGRAARSVEHLPRRLPARSGVPVPQGDRRDSSGQRP